MPCLDPLSPSSPLRFAACLSLLVSFASVALAQDKKKEPVPEPGLLLHFGVGKGKLSREGDLAIDATSNVRAKVLGKVERAIIGPGEGISFNGENAYLQISPDIADSKPALPSAEMTAEAWVNVEKPEHAGAFIAVAQDNADAEQGWILGYSDDAFYFALASSGADDGNGHMTYVRSSTPYSTGKWYHVAGTYDGRRLRLYVNGKLAGESAQQRGAILYPSHAPYTIGAFKDDDELTLLKGAMVEVKVFNRALADQEIAAAYDPGAKLASWDPPVETTQRFVVKPYLQWSTMNSMTIMWETSKPGKGYVRYGDQLPYAYQSQPGPEGTFHEITIDNLQPGTNYFYRAHTLHPDGTELLSDDLTFQTSVRPDAAYAFVVIGDTQKNPQVIATLQQFAFSLRPNFEIHLGDVVNTGPDRLEWTEEFLAGSYPLMSRVCMFPSLGNHEENHSLYYKYFKVQAPEDHYTYRYGNAQFFILNTNIDVSPGSAQWNWLDAELAKSDAKWKFVYHHHPVYSSDSDDYGDTFKEQSTWGSPRHRPLAQLYEKHHVDINFTGHIHAYERTWPLRAGQVDHASGVIYITSGGGGGGLETAAPQKTWFSRRTYKGHHITYVMIHDAHLELQAFDLEGRLFDTMTLHKP